MLWWLMACGGGGDGEALGPTGDTAAVVASDTTTADTETETSTMGDSSASTDSGAAPTEVPTGAGDLDPWLATGTYLSWAAEGGPHPSTGPHFGDVRTYVNDALFASLSDGAGEHPVGATAVKELYGNGSDVRGYAVMVKVDPGVGGDTWYWYEVYDGTVYGDGVGVGICTGCHSAGVDSVLTPFPLQ